jgi:hypothetical protein
MEKPTIRTTVTFVYCGVRLFIEGNKPAHIYWPVPEGGAPEGVPLEARPLVEQCKLWKKKLLTARVGSVVSIEMEGSSAYMNTAKLVGHVPQVIAAELEAQSKAVELGEQVRKYTQGQAKESSLFDSLEPVRRAYRRCHNATDRAALLARVLLIIQGPG